MKQTLSIVLAVLAMLSNAYSASFSENIGSHYSRPAWTGNIRTPSDVPAKIDPSKSYADNLADFTSTVANLSAYNVTVLQNFGGKEASTVALFMSAVQADAGAGLRSHMAAKGSLTTNYPKAYWQIGNEINNPTLSASFHTWLNDGLPGAWNDQSIISAYVEYWLAPAVAGLRQGNPNAKIILGSVANAANASAVSFLAALVDYTILGTNAPSLAGKRVRDVVNTGSIHYSMTSTNWMNPIRVFTDRGMKVWSTEEVGNIGATQGLCMVRFVKSAGRLFSLTDPGKLFIWGASISPNSCDSMASVVADAAGSNALVPVASKATGTGLEVYAYRAGTQRLEFIMSDSGTLTGVEGTGTVYVYDANGVTPYAASLTMNIPLTAGSAVFSVTTP